MGTPPNIQCLIVDDNAFIREVLKDLLEEAHPEVVIIGTAANGSEAVHYIETLQPQLVFLDVEMPDMSGFEVLARCTDRPFQTIFVTSHSHYAIQAIRFNALDYLVKPVKPKELAQALRRFRSQRHTAFQQSQVDTALQNLEKESTQEQILFLPTQDGGLKMALKEIIVIEGDRNYSSIRLTRGRTRLSAKTLGYFEEILAGEAFFRCHRSYLVNRQHVEQLRSDGFVLKDKEEIPVSRRRKKLAKEWFGR